MSDPADGNNARMPTEPIIANCTFAFECPRTWEDLSETKDSKVRNCRHCRRDVHLVETNAEWTQRLAEGACVAVRSPGGMRVGTLESDYEKGLG